AGKHDVPVIRHFSAHDGGTERGLRPAEGAGAEERDPLPGGRDAGAGATGAVCGPEACATLRRPATESRPRPGARKTAEGAAPGRTPGRPRQETARTHAV